MPWDARVHTAVLRSRPACGLHMTWHAAMQDADSMTRYYRCEVRVGKLEQPLMGMRWYTLQVSV